MLDAAIISYAVRYEDAFLELQRSGISEEHFVDEYRTVWRHIKRNKAEHDSIPSPDALRIRFPDLELPQVKRRDVPDLLRQAKQRHRYMRFIKVVDEAVTNATSFEGVEEVIQNLQSQLNKLAFADGKAHLVDMFSDAINEQMLEEIQKRRSGKLAGIPSGLNRLDTIAGGLMKQQMVTIIARSGIGKSWLNLLFVASAVTSGHKVVLYPLEMNLTETAFRLYTIFSHKMFGASKVLKNYDLSQGKVSKQKVVRILNALEDKFQGQLYVADVSSLADPYTVERIEAEVEMHKPDLFWVDYLTLLKPPTQSHSSDSDWQAVRDLSHGIKNIAMRRDTVGGSSAQVNREAIRANVFLPRLEHISYGDSIGQDSDKVISINRKNGYMYYALVKHRGGPEIGPTKVKWDVNTGDIEETPDVDDIDELDDIGNEEGPEDA